MAKIFILAAVCSMLSFACFAQKAKPLKINFRNIGRGGIAVAKGRIHSVIDLSREVNGCAYVSGKQKRELNKSSCASPPATFKLLDTIVENNQTFLVVQSDAMGNCNVCGHCGASEAYALIWLKLDVRLRVVNKQSIPIDDCLANISSSAVKAHENDNLSDLRLSFKKNTLTVVFEKTIFNANSDISGYEFSTLEYDRKTPEKGFIIKTEKRGKTSIEE